MTVAAEAIAIGVPVIASNAIFATRRFSRGVDAMDNNIFEGIGDIGLCAGQILKGFNALKDGLNEAIETASRTSTHSSVELIKNASASEAQSKNFANMLNRISKSADFAKQNGSLIGRVYSAVDKISDNINPVIYTIGGIKVLGAKKEDRLETAAVEASAITAMRIGEETYKKIFGWKTSKSEVKQSETAKKVIDSIKTKVKNIDAVAKFAEKNSSLIKVAPKAAKGIFFAVTSVEGYKLGKKCAYRIIGKEEPKTNKTDV